MKTTIKKTIAILIFITVCTSLIIAQNDVSDKKPVHIKIIKEINGKVTEIDTTVNDLKDFEMKDIEHHSFNSNETKPHKKKMIVIESTDKIDCGHLKGNLIKHLPKPGAGCDSMVEEMMIMFDDIDSLGKFTNLSKDSVKCNKRIIICGDSAKVRHMMKFENRVLHENSGNDSIKIVKIIEFSGDDSLRHIDFKDCDVLKHTDIQNNNLKEKICIKHLDELPDSLKKHMKGETICINKTKNGTEIIIRKVIITSLDNTDKGNLEKSGIKTEIPETESELKINSLQYYPNPSKGNITLKFSLPNAGKTNITVYDSFGKRVFFEDLGKLKGEVTRNLDLPQSQPGIYFLQIRQGKKLISKKILIE